MAVSAGEAYVEIIPQVDSASFAKAASGAGATFSSSVSDKLQADGDKTGSDYGKSIGSGFNKNPPNISEGMSRSGREGGQAFGASALESFKGYAETIGITLAAVGVIEFFKGAIQAANEAKQVNQLTAAAIKSTGDASLVTAQQVQQLGFRLAEVDGIDHNVIQTGENLLLTFTNIKNGVGQGNDIFNQAAAAAVNMASAMNHGEVNASNLKETSLALGKALQDPILGMTSLRRVGVVLDDQQQTQIKTFIAAGDTMSAQKIILAELSKEFGGAAEAAATPAQKMKVAWQDLKTQVGEAILPALEKVADWIARTMVPAISSFVDGLMHGNDAAGAISSTFGHLGDIIHNFAIGPVADAFSRLGDAIRGTISVLQDVFGWMSKNQAVVATFVGVIGSVIVATKLWAAAMALVDLVMAVNPFGLIVVAIAALAAGIVYAYTHFQTFRTIVQDTWKVIQDVTTFAWNNVLKPTFEAIGVVAVFVWNNVIKPAWDALSFYIKNILSPYIMFLWNDIVKPAFQGIAAEIKFAWENVIQPIWAAISAVIRDVLAPVFTFLWNDIVRPTWDAISSRISVAWNDVIRPVFGFIVDYIQNIVAPVLMFLWHDVIVPVWDGISGKISSVWAFLRDNVFAPLTNLVKNDIPAAFGAAVNAISSLWDGLKHTIGDPINFVIQHVYLDAMKPLFEGVASALGDSIKLPDIQPIHFSRGGVVPGSGAEGDWVPIYATAGERVLSLDQVAAMGGNDQLDRMLGRGAGAGNTDGHYAFGGSILSDLGSAASFVAGKVASLIPGGVFSALNPVIDVIKNAISSIAGAGDWGKIVSSAATRLLNDGVNMLKPKDVAPVASVASFGPATGATSGLGGPVSGSLADWITAASRYVSIEWPAGLETLIMRESAGDPMSYNGWDINAQNGDPSRGLMQTIGSTFERYRSQALPDNIYDPVANIVAGMNYVHSRYGSLFNVQQANASMPPMGYDNGGPLAPGDTLVRNNTGHTEMVLNPSQGNALLQKISADQSVSVKVYVDGVERDAQMVVERKLNDVIRQLGGL